MECTIMHPLCVASQHWHCQGLACTLGIQQLTEDNQEPALCSVTEASAASHMEYIPWLCWHNDHALSPAAWMQACMSKP